MARVANLAAEVTADIGPLQAQMKEGGRAVERFTARSVAAGQRFDTSMRRSMASTGNFQRGIQNAAFQVGDFAVQVGGGTSAVRAMSMQLPQLLGGFGVMGAVVGAAVAILGPFAQGLFESAENAERLTTALQNAKTKTEELTLATRQAVLGASAEELAIRDAIAAKMGEIAELQVAMNRRGGQDAALYREQLATRQQELATLQEQLTALRQAEEQHKRALQDIKELTDIERMLGEQMIAVTAETRAFANEMERAASAATAAAIETRKMMGFRQRFKSEDALMSQSLTPMDVGDTEEGRRRARAARKTGGGAGSKISARDNLEIFMQSLMTQAEAEIDSYNLRKQKLDEFLQAKLISQEEYNDVSQKLAQQHAEAMSRIDVYRYGTGVEKAGAFFGDMARVFQSGNEKMFKIAKAFGAAQALISAYQGAAEALKLPFPQNLAAYAQVLATGLGAVSAIQGASVGGGGGRAGAAAPAAPRFSQAVAITLNGSESATYSKGQIRGLINQINEAVEGGARIRLA